MKNQARYILSTLVISTLLVTLNSCQKVSKVHYGWDFDQAHEVNYSVSLERGFVGGKPEAIENFSLKLKFTGNKKLEVEKNGVNVGSFYVTSKGDLEYGDTAKVAPYVSAILVLTLPPNGVNASQGETWVTEFPGADHVAAFANKIVMQDRYTVRLASSTGTATDALEIAGQVKLVKNAFAESMLSDTSGSFAQLYNLNVFLTGTASYDKNVKAIDHLDAYYLLMPKVNLTADSIKQSRHRQHAVITRVP